MKKLIILAVVLVATASAFAQTKAGKIDNTRHSVLSVCPVNTSVVINELGKCPFCGMDLNLSQKEQIKTDITKAYSCPLYADVTANKAGRKLNISPKEEMKMKIMGLNITSAYSDERKLVARQ